MGEGPRAEETGLPGSGGMGPGTGLHTWGELTSARLSRQPGDGGQGILPCFTRLTPEKVNGLL